jgi:eukaryotic-like serine/threonine-protein kinase
MSDGSLLTETGSGMGQIGDLAFVNDRTLAAVGTSGHLLLLDVESGREITHLKTHNLTQGVLDVSSNGKTLLVGSGDGSLKLIETDRLLAPTVLWHDSDVRHVAFTGSGRTLLTADSSGNLTVWDLEDGTAKKIKEAGESLRICSTQRRGALVATSGADDSVSIYNFESGDLAATIKVPGTGAITAVTFSPDDSRLALGRRNGTLVCYSTDDWSKLPVEVSEIGGGINAIEYSNDGRSLVVACADELVRFFDATTGNQRPWSFSVSAVPLSVCYCESDTVIAVGTATGELQLWDAVTQTLRVALKAHTSRVSTLRVSPNGTTLVSGGRDRRLQLWDTKSGERLTTLRGHGRQFFSVDISPDGKTIASGGLSGDVRIWRTQP